MDARAQQINLYNPALRRQRNWFTLANVGLLAGLFALVLLAGGGLLKRQAEAKQTAARALDTRLATARAESARLAVQQTQADEGGAPARELADLRQQLAARTEVLVALQGGAGLESVRAHSTIGFSDYLRGLARQTVDGLWLTGFSVDQGGSGMEVRGRMLGVSRLPEYIQRLNKESSFKGRQFVSLNIARSDRSISVANGTPFSSFVLTAMPDRDDAARKKEPTR